MEQPVPKVTDKDVERIALRDFGMDKLSEAMDILEKYGKQEWTRPGSPRVRLAVLKLANGELEELSRYTKIAIQDFRDVISMAEYPIYSAEVGFERVAQNIQKAAIEADWEQYQDWLKKE
ncbi:MAG: hypothetical protein JXA81_00640 [Sedimentisphaerales bacterium]|nr:hypothetical protein [Sedimentisphaerales bacterium]